MSKPYKPIYLTFLSATLLFGAVFSTHASINNPVDPNAMWEKYQNNPGFQQALDELAISYDNLVNPAYASTYDAKNPDNPLFWLNRTLTIYENAEQGRYQIPVTEAHEEGRDRTAGKGRNNYFLTHTWGKKDDRVTLRLGEVPQNVSCSAAIDPEYEHPRGITGVQALNANTETTYTFSQDALLVVGCEDQTKKMENTDQLISVDIVQGGTYHPLFIFGLHDTTEWKRQAEAPTPSGYHFMFDGRVRFVANQDIAQQSANNNILQTLRQSLLRTITYDKLNGMDGSNWLHHPSRGLLFATYQSCCWANGGNGLVGIGQNPINETPDWLDWHEYGHQFQVEWSWDDQSEVTVNLYSLAACYTTLGDVDITQCHPNEGLSGFSWDQQAVGTMLNSGQTWDFNSEEVFRRATFFGELMTSWPQLYPALGKAFREIHHSDSAKVDTSQEKIDWFMLNASKISGVNLNSFFQQWNMPLSAEAISEINALNLPQPIKVAKTFTGYLTETSAAQVTIPGEENTINIAIVTNTPTAGPTSMVWAEYGETPLYAQVVDSRNRTLIVKLRGQIQHGVCTIHTVNSAANCYSGTDNYVSVNYKAEDNPLLPPGSYTGVLHLMARDWHNKDWTANVNVNLAIVK